MKSMTKNQILKTTRCRFFIWHPSIDLLEVTKKSLRMALRSNRTYTAEITETGRHTYKYVGYYKEIIYHQCLIGL